MNNKLVTTNKLRQHVVECLDSVGYFAKGEEIVIHCPFHDDGSPSCGVHIGDKITPGGFNCLSCGASGGWNKLAERLHLPQFVFDNTHFDASKKTNLKDDDPFKDIQDAIKGLFFRDEQVDVLEGTEDLPEDFSWRGLPKRFYESLGGRYYWDKKQDLDYLYFPLKMNNEYRGYTICALQPAKLKYLTFAPTEKTMLLYDELPTNSNMVITEGHFDGLRMYYEGIPSVSIFGVQNWSKIKRNYILAKAPKKIILLMDSDEAGQKAANFLASDLEQGADVLIYKLPQENGIDGKPLDPGNMPDQYIEHLKEIVYE